MLCKVIHAHYFWIDKLYASYHEAWHFAFVARFALLANIVAELKPIHF